MEAALPSNPNPPPLIESLDPHPPHSETLPSYDFNPPPLAEILASDSNGPPKPPLTETLVSDAQNPFPNPQAATEKTTSRCRRHSRWDPQPESENLSGGGKTEYIALEEGGVRHGCGLGYVREAVMVKHEQEQNSTDFITIMASDNPKAVEAEPPPSSWKERIVFPTLLVGILGGGAGLVSKHRKVMGLPTSCVTDAANFAIVTACSCVKLEKGIK
ncbi:hypothetical protein C1H46_025778 [Malus baccata]|uniref:Uncharacterized protein n=1 Tax=Malus baccata TaxID=106549 RepID=A0A540LQ82_MALBA|nr:hypothetical protein C1H46_025778 [Malus baccata]